MKRFSTELSQQLKEARLEIDPEFEQPLTRDNFMILSDLRPGDNDDHINYDDVKPDELYNLNLHRDKYTLKQLKDCENFIEKEKQKAQENDNVEETLPTITFENLNSMQGFVFKLVEDFQHKNEQLLHIVNGEGGFMA